MSLYSFLFGMGMGFVGCSVVWISGILYYSGERVETNIKSGVYECMSRVVRTKMYLDELRTRRDENELNDYDILELTYEDENNRVIEVVNTKTQVLEPWGYLVNKYPDVKFVKLRYYYGGHIWSICLKQETYDKWPIEFRNRLEDLKMGHYKFIQSDHNLELLNECLGPDGDFYKSAGIYQEWKWWFPSVFNAIDNNGEMIFFDGQYLETSF